MDVFSHIDVSIPKLQGNLGVHRAVYEYGRLGYNILWPLCDSAKYDLVIEKDGKFQRVQVKTSRTNHEYRNTRNDGSVNKTTCLTRWHVTLATSGGNTRIHTRTVRQDDDYDVLFVLVANGKCWSIPVDEMVARNSTIICEEKHLSYEL
jgi:hypothetical protein